MNPLLETADKAGVFALTESQLWLAERKPTGFLVALWLDPATSEKLALPSGESSDSLHVTIAFCGDAEELGELGQAKAITAVADAVSYRDPIKGVISGYGRFRGTESSDGSDVFYATPDLPSLFSLRECILDCLSEQGVPVNTNHGYTPHITLAYLDSGAENPVSEIEPLELVFNAVTIMIGTRRIDVPFWSPNPMMEEPVSMSEAADIPASAPLGAHLARPLYFGTFDKEWIPFLPKPGQYVHEHYGNMDFSTDTYAEILRNFNNYVYKQDLPIRATHTAPEAGAVGWIKPGGMRLAEDGSLEVKPEWNDLGRGLIQGDRFRYGSAEFCRTWTNPVTQEQVKNVAVGLALVTRPHFKTDVLNPLSASEELAFAESQALFSGETGKGTTMSDLDPGSTETPAVPAAPAAPLIPAVPAAPAIALSDLSQIVITAEQRANERQMFADLTTRVELAERRATTAESELRTLRHDRLKEKFTAEVLGRSAENGEAWFGSVQDNITHLVSLAEAHGPDSTEVQWAITQKRSEARAIRATGLFDPIALGGADQIATVESQVNHLVRVAMEKNVLLSEDAAISQVYNEHPDLYLRSINKKR